MRTPLRRLVTTTAVYHWVHRERVLPSPACASGEASAGRPPARVLHRVSIWREPPSQRGRSALLLFVVQTESDARRGSPLNVGLQANGQPAPNLNQPATIRALIAWAEAQHWQGQAPLSWHGDLAQLMDLLATVANRPID